MLQLICIDRWSPQAKSGLRRRWVFRPPKSAAEPVRRSMYRWNHYYRPQTIQDALRVLIDSHGQATPVAGGTDLLLDIQQGRHSPVPILVDLTSIPELTAVEKRLDEIYIGAAVPLSRIVNSPLVAQNAHALVEACDLIGGPQVRNSATLGGNVAHALPAADGTIALVALDASVEIAVLALESAPVFERRPIESLFGGPGISTLQSESELISGFYIRLQQEGEGSAFKRVMRPQGVALPILNLAVWLVRSAGEVGDIRIAVGPSGPKPRRSRKAEALLRGKILTPDLLKQAEQALLSEVLFRTSPHRASSQYRRLLSTSLLESTIQEAWQRALDRGR
jgi:xanthine dehydrogenase FAD-binding subunit